MSFFQLQITKPNFNFINKIEKKSIVKIQGVCVGRWDLRSQSGPGVFRSLPPLSLSSSSPSCKPHLLSGLFCMPAPFLLQTGFVWTFAYLAVGTQQPTGVQLLFVQLQSVGFAAQLGSGWGKTDSRAGMQLPELEDSFNHVTGSGIFSFSDGLEGVRHR